MLGGLFIVVQARMRAIEVGAQPRDRSLTMPLVLQW
jgi:hypothetical protein